MSMYEDDTIHREELDGVTILLTGDSGDGMQSIGTQLTQTSAIAGNDLATLPDYPAEIRAPAGTRAGVSGFQLQFSSQDVFTPGDEADVLIAMNPAALITAIPRLKSGGILIVNQDKFTDRELDKADLETNPLEDGTVSGYRVVPVPLSSLTKASVKDLGLNAKMADRCKNFFALGIAYWLYSRDPQYTQEWIRQKYKGKDVIIEANLRALQGGINFALTTDLFEQAYEVPPAKLQPGTYRNITGNHALAIGLAAAAKLSDLNVFYGSYPITPASDVLHNLAGYKHYGVTTFQAEDEIAAACAAIGASWAGSLGVTGTSGPGLALKGEAIGLAMMIELPLIVVNVQRGGPSTGLPTKTEQSDLMMAKYGRNGESPMVVIAAATPADCFEVALEAARLTLEHMVPVMLLTDGYLGNGSEPWRLPELAKLSPIQHRKPTEHNNPGGPYLPYRRDPETLARPWATPGMAGFEHRVGGLEKEEETGNVSYDPANHERMCQLRQEKVSRVARDIPAQTVFGPEEGDLLVLGWGSTFGAIRQAVTRAQSRGHKVAHAHLRYLNPYPENLEQVLRSYRKVLVPELNLGQLVKLLRQEFLIDAASLPKIQGQPFTVREIEAAMEALLQSSKES